MGRHTCHAAEAAFSSRFTAVSCYSGPLLQICDFGLARGIADGSETKDMGLTEYVVTRWYRAPELLVDNQGYSTAIDVWAVGCIFAEMLGRKALFPGTDYLDQLRRIIDVLGSPSSDDLAFMTNKQAVHFLQSLPKRRSKKWSDVFPDISPQVLTSPTRPSRTARNCRTARQKGR